MNESLKSLLYIREQHINATDKDWRTRRKRAISSTARCRSSSMPSPPLGPAVESEALISQDFPA